MEGLAFSIASCPDLQGSLFFGKGCLLEVKYQRRCSFPMTTGGFGVGATDAVREPLSGSFPPMAIGRSKSSVGLWLCYGGFGGQGGGRGSCDDKEIPFKFIK